MIWALAVAALGVALYALTDGFGEAVRAVIFFAIPSTWGGYCLAVLDSRPTAIESLSEGVQNAMAGVAGLVIAGVVLLDAPISIANVPLGLIEAAFLVLKITEDRRRRRIGWSETTKAIVRMTLILVTVICLVVAVTL